MVCAMSGSAHHGRGLTPAATERRARSKKDVRAGATVPRTSSGPDPNRWGAAVKAHAQSAASIPRRWPGRIANISAASPPVIATAMFRYESS